MTEVQREVQARIGKGSGKPAGSRWEDTRCEQGHEEREGHPWVGQTGRPRGSPERDRQREMLPQGPFREEGRGSHVRPVAGAERPEAARAPWDSGVCFPSVRGTMEASTAL